MTTTIKSNRKDRIVVKLDKEYIDLLKLRGKHLTKSADKDGTTLDNGDPLVFNLDTMIEIELVDSFKNHLESTLEELKERFYGIKRKEESL